MATGFPKPNFRHYRAADPATVERDMLVWEARLRGTRPQQIAEELGISLSQVAGATHRAAKMIALESAEEHVKAEVERIDILLQNAIEVLEKDHYATSHGKVMFDPSTDPPRPMIDTAPTLKAIDTIIKLMERRAKLLGLDAPTRTEHAVNLQKVDAQDLELMDMINQVRAQMALGLDNMQDNNSNNNGEKR